MNEKNFIYLIVFGVIVLGPSNVTSELITDETKARLFAQHASDKFFNTIDTIKTEMSHENSNPDAEMLFQNISTIAANIFEETKKFDFKNFNDKNLKFIFESIRDCVGEFVIGQERSYEIFYTIYQLTNLSKSHDIKEYHDRSIDIKYDPDVKNIIKSTNDTDELEYYWTEWRKISGAWADNNLHTLVEGLQEAAKFRDMSPLEFWLQKNNITEMENLMAAIKPLYIELHAFIRSQLQKKYADSIIKPDGLIPDHLFEQVLAQAWSNNSVIEDVFPLKNLPPVESVMKKRFKAINLYEIAERFYEHLGFEKYPYKIIKPHDDDDDECEAKVFYSTPDIRLEFCEKMNFMDFLQAYAQMGNIYYAQQMTGLPAYFFETKGLEDAIGNAVILSTSTHHNLKAIGMILDFNFTKEVEINRILRKAIQKVLNLPLDFVHMKVMADLMSEKVKSKELNKHYWELMDKYAGIGPPNDGGSNTLDLPYNFFMDMNENEMSRKFNMEILSYQIYKRLCELSEKYPKEDLHLCDMHGSKDAGDALKKMMKLGSSKPMDEVLATMFHDNPKVMVDSLLEYYNPLKVMIGEINKEANVKLGWKKSEIN